MKRKNKVLFVGPLPPPVGGFSVATKFFLENVLQELDVKIFNRAPKYTVSGKRNILVEFARLVWSIFLFAFQLSLPRRASVYIALSGGVGQIAEIPFLVLARIFSAKVFLHHHSFAYINERSVLFNTLIKICGKSCTHIVLCDHMASKLAEVYGEERVRTRVLSNSFMFSPSDFPDISRKHSKKLNGKYTIGYLSNITLDKGFDTFIEIMKEILSKGLPVRFRVAGPADAASAKLIADAISIYGESFEYVGPVYGEDKSAFLDSLHLFLFPSRYVNEAQPLVIIEALSYGAAVISTGRGCCSTTLTGMNYSMSVSEGEYFNIVADLLRGRSYEDYADEVQAVAIESQGRAFHDYYESISALKSIIIDIGGAA